jgi:hypothetical protein
MRSESVVEEIFAVAKQQLDDEDKRDAVLTTKANTVLGASGLSLTVAFTFGAFLLQHPERIAFGRVGFDVVVAVFALSLLLGLLASYFALRSMRVSQFEYISEKSVFDNENLRDADSAFEKAWTESGGDRSVADLAAVSVYRRYLTAHLWGMYQRTFDKLEQKAETVKFAQRLYVAFLATIIVIGMALTVSAVTGRIPTTTPVGNTPDADIDGASQAGSAVDAERQESD